MTELFLILITSVIGGISAALTQNALNSLLSFMKKKFQFVSGSMTLFNM